MFDFGNEYDSGFAADDAEPDAEEAFAEPAASAASPADVTAELAAQSAPAAAAAVEPPGLEEVAVGGVVAAEAEAAAATPADITAELVEQFVQPAAEVEAAAEAAPGGTQPGATRECYLSIRAMQSQTGGWCLTFALLLKWQTVSEV